MYSDNRDSSGDASADFVCIEEQAIPTQSPIKKLHSDTVFTPTPLRKANIIHPSFILPVNFKVERHSDDDKAQEVPNIMHDKMVTLSERDMVDRDPILRDPSLEDLKFPLRIPVSAQLKHKESKLPCFCIQIAMLLMAAGMSFVSSIFLPLILDPNSTFHKADFRIEDANDLDGHIFKDLLDRSVTFRFREPVVEFEKMVNIDGLTWEKAFQIMKADSNNPQPLFLLKNTRTNTRLGCKCQYQLRSDMSLHRLCHCSESLWPVMETLAKWPMESVPPKTERLQYSLAIREPSIYEDLLEKTRTQCNWALKKLKWVGINVIAGLKCAGVVVKEAARAFCIGSSPPAKKILIAAKGTSEKTILQTWNLYKRWQSVVYQTAQIVVSHCKRFASSGK